MRKKPAVKITFLRNVIIYLADKKKGKKTKIITPLCNRPSETLPSGPIQSTQW